MSSFLQLWIERFRNEPGQDEAIASRIGHAAPVGRSEVRRYFLRLSMMAALVCLALGLASRLSWSQEPQEQEQEEGGLNDTSLGKKGPKEEKKPAEVVPPPAGITFSTRLDHTAVWVGDQFHYMVTVDYAPEYEFVLDNLTKETVNMDPFQVMDVRKQTTALKSGNKRLFVDLTLANFGTGQAGIQIPQFTLYYFHKTGHQAGAEQAAAESLTIPGIVIGLRSTLPPQPSDIRDAITVNSWERARWALPIAGWICAVIVGIGFLWELALFIRSRKTRKGPDRRKAMEAVRARWASAVPSDFSDPRAAASFYTHSYHDLKEYMGYYLETPTLGLTADELQEEMQRLDASPDLTERVAKVLGACETMSYARDGMASNAEAAPGVAQNIREILSTRASD